MVLRNDEMFFIDVEGSKNLPITYPSKEVLVLFSSYSIVRVISALFLHCAEGKVELLFSFLFVTGLIRRCC